MSKAFKAFKSSSSLEAQSSMTTSNAESDTFLDFTLKYLLLALTVLLMESINSIPAEALITRMDDALATGRRSKIKMMIVNSKEPMIAISIMLAPQAIPTLIDQNKNTKSIGSLMAVRKRTMDNAPTIPREITMLACTVKITIAVIKDNAAREILKFLL